MSDVRRAAVLGRPVQHSLSPVLHSVAYADLGLSAWTYDRVDIGTAEELRDFVGSLGAEWVGLSLTMPLKRLVQPLLTTVSPTASAVGAVNTVVLDGAGGAHAGHNTDVHGVVAALREGGVDRLAAGEAVVLGGGATAASAVAALARLGDLAPVVVVRSPDRATEVVQAAQRLGSAPRLVTFDDADGGLLTRCSAAVSTVPVSASDDVASLVARAGRVRGVLLDVVYAPWPTPLATAWQQAGGDVVGGFVMLLHQAVQQVRLFTGRAPDVELMRAAGLRELAARART